MNIEVTMKKCPDTTEPAFSKNKHGGHDQRRPGVEILAGTNISGEFQQLSKMLDKKVNPLDINVF